MCRCILGSGQPRRAIGRLAARLSLRLGSPRTAGSVCIASIRGERASFAPGVGQSDPGPKCDEGTL